MGAASYNTDLTDLVADSAATGNWAALGGGSSALNIETDYFIEGTRFTQKKHDKQNSPFQHLLKPKAGGIGFVLEAMGGNLHKIVNITIHYPEGIPTFSDFLGGQIKQVNVNVEVSSIEDELIGNYVSDRNFKIKFQKWVNQLWLDKDQKLIEFNNDNHSK